MSKFLRIDTSPSVVIQFLNESIRKRYPFIKSIVFSAEQTYEDSIVAGRTIDYSIWQDKARYLNPEQKNLLPMLSWTRSILQKNDTGLGRRFQIQEHIQSENKNIKADSFVGQLNYTFNIYTTNMNDVERFEIDWYTGKGLKNLLNTINVNLGPDLGVFSYSLIWEENLDSIDWSLEGNYYKSLSGSAKINGTFLSVEQRINDPESNIGRIYDIEFEMLDCNARQIFHNRVIADKISREIIEDRVTSD